MLMLYKCVFVSLERIKFFKNIISDNLVTIDSIPKKGKEFLLNKKKKRKQVTFSDLFMYLSSINNTFFMVLLSNNV